MYISKNIARLYGLKKESAVVKSGFALGKARRTKITFPIHMELLAYHHYHRQEQFMKPLNAPPMEIHNRIVEQLGRQPDLDEIGFIVTALRAGRAVWTKRGDTRLIRKRKLRLKS